jgi:predicted AlkP superfamily pyrophosphatase or phosphodiesterase
MILRGLVICAQAFVSVQAGTAASEAEPAPKLVVGIVVDQMRYDFIYRYWNEYGEGGFKRLVKEGAFYRNAEYNYVPTFTGPGHASIFTGTTPASHGIVANDWFDRARGKTVYCVEDTNYTSVGVANASDGPRSPSRLLATTVTDELKLATPASKVVGISLKDRAAILPAGHLADGAYWFDDRSGSWITSSYYTNTHTTPHTNMLPEWVASFNGLNRAGWYLKTNWTTLKDITAYGASLPNDDPSKKKLSRKEDHLGFPHDLPVLFDQEATNKNRFGLIRTTPFGNSLTKEFAEAAVRGEGLGRSDHTDFLTINFASTDYAGHRFGPRSVEVEDVYLRLDGTLSEFLGFLDGWVGRTNVIVFLTADHGVVDVPNTSTNAGPHSPAEVFDWDRAKKSLTDRMEIKYGGKLMAHFINQQIYFDTNFVALHHHEQADIEEDVRDWLVQQEGVADVIASRNLRIQAGSGVIYSDLANGFYPRRSGDMTVLLQPGWLDKTDVGEGTATSHGTPYQYDTHVPILFWGWHVPHLVCDEPVTITEIAPTLCQLLKIQFPSASMNSILPGLRIEDR